MIRLTAVALVMSLVVVASGCSIGRDRDSDSNGDGAVLESGESLGSIERLPGGTPAASDVRTLLSAQCADGVLTLRTNREEIASPMDCGQMLPEGVIARFIGQPVAIRAQEGRLIVENPTAGTMDFPAAEPRVTEIASAP
ncbi:MAG: hypothetical protein WD359_00530 [Dehalococcoidia bacterium]